LTFNTLGTFGVLFFAAGLAGQKPRRTLIVVGLALVVLTQYRTGIIASLVVFAIYLVAQRRVSRLVFASMLVLCVVFVTQTAEFQHLWLRGSSAEVVGSLSGRETYWSAAFKAVRESPVVGLGIKSGTRFVVLVNPADADTSSLHNTWVEALVGVGVLGLATLLVAFLMALVRAAKRMHTPEGLLALLLLASIGVRSTTGTTIELAGLTPLVFLAAVSISESASRRRRGVASADPPAELHARGVP
jgi:O-antigen ligase